jgi:hypothetical protein
MFCAAGHRSREWAVWNRSRAGRYPNPNFGMSVAHRIHAKWSFPNQYIWFVSFCPSVENKQECPWKLAVPATNLAHADWLQSTSLSIIRDFLKQNNVTEKYSLYVKTQFFRNNILIRIIWVVISQVGFFETKNCFVTSRFRQLQLNGSFTVTKSRSDSPKFAENCGHIIARNSFWVELLENKDLLQNNFLFGNDRFIT